MPKIKDIADRTSYSVATVSRVLSGDETLKVSPETRQAILKAARDMGYRKKARLMKTDRTVGIVLWHSLKEESEDDYYQGLRKSVETQLLKNGMRPQLIYLDDSGSWKFTDTFDGIIAIGKFTHDDVRKFHEKGKNVVLVDSCTSLDMVDSVRVDLEAVTEDALNLLWDSGHRDIGFICGRESIGSSRTEVMDLREKEYHRFMEEKGIPMKDRKYRIGTFGMKSGYRLMKEEIGKYGKDLPTAYFIASDYLTLGALKALHESNLDVPEDVRIISVDDLDFIRYTRPTITSISIDKEHLSDAAVHLLLERFRGREYTKKVVINHRIRYRDSFPEPKRKELS